MTTLTSLLVPCEFDPMLWTDATLGRIVHQAAQCLYERDDEGAQSALAEIPEDLPSDVSTAYLICVLWLLNQQRDLTAALALYEQKRKSIDPSTPLGAYAQYQAAVALVAARRNEEALELLAVSEYTFREFDENVALGLTHAVVGGALSNLGDVRSCVKYFASSHELLVAHGTDLQITRSSFNLVFAYAVIGRHEDALELARQLHERLTDATQAPERSLVLGRLEYCCELLGRIDEAIEWNAKHSELARMHKQDGLLICLEIDRAYFTARQKRYDEAERIITAIPNASEVDSGHYRLRLSFTRGLLALARGNSDDAHSAFAEAIHFCTSDEVKDELGLRFMDEIVQLTRTNDGLPRPDYADTYITFLKQRGNEIDHASSSIIDAHGRYAARLAQYQREREELLYTTILEAGEQTRRDVATAIHDGAGQELAVIALQLDLALSHVTDDSPAHSILNKTRARVIDTARDLRSLSHALASHNLERDGLPSALYELAGRVRSSSRLTVSCVVDESLAALPIDLARTIYRTVQTLVGNTLQHAYASNLEISVAAEDDVVTVRVHDDGRGMNDSDLGDGIGWKSIRARTELRGGTFSVTSQLDKGTTVVATFGYKSR